ncbi:uncharacterized protein LOC123551584 [Mercenaria mercenaria]|uniref:uncharacterized protein LOC123551584 n=1 Tax=Mercenaria mercenaria TaxID=6596 RepID=UPI001E1D906F|nr:uncharacterized protein LOC123551584 [Mercenaria mercenaria]
MQQLVFVVCLLVPISAQLSMYTVGNFPDPIERYQACGRPRPSFICDPSGRLPESTADTIDNLVKSIYNETTVPCYSSGPRATRRKGYIVMVAVVPKMERYFTLDKKGYSMHTRYREAQYFSYYLGQSIKWGKHSSNCKEMVIILYSVEDGVLYTSTQAVARRRLTDEKVQDTVMEALTIYYPFNSNVRRAAETIEYLVRNYGESLREDVATA